eukprot:CAMPEP_0197516914 /NCGR_PEP_ID=MMETSP1318-20131121/1865_1 /TAXON_ID=552666 /ORGANISM="Partenskyella glossopodia, Strain RCC365" /LENGTH=399 /DNA_ID=CAMNT_0043066053 /DNA_START=35 /DNA_END=1234 /DNA_ORIENTATION=-
MLPRAAVRWLTRQRARSGLLRTSLRWAAPRSFAGGVAAGLGLWAWAANAEGPGEEDKAHYISTGDDSPYLIFSGNGNKSLSSEVAMLLGCQLGRAKIGQFQDGEINIRFHDSARGKHIYIIQPTCYPPNDNLMELLLMVSTLRRASAETITAVIPYYGYSRQLSPISKEGDRCSLAAADVAVMLKTVGVDQVVSVDLHRGQIEGFFENEIQVENLDVTRCQLPYLKRLGLKEPVVVPIGSVKKGKYLRDHISKMGVGDTDLGFIFYTSIGGFENINDDTHPDEEDITKIKGHKIEFVGDVSDRDVLVLTDLVDTGSRVCSAANHLQSLGARRIFALSTHGLLTGNAVQSINDSALDEMVMFNTIPVTTDSPKIRTLSIAPLVAETISRVHKNKSIKELY